MVSSVRSQDGSVNCIRTVLIGCLMRSVVATLSVMEYFNPISHFLIEQSFISL